VTPHPISFYAGETRRFLDKNVFTPARSRLVWLPVHVAIIAGCIVLSTKLLANGVAWPLLLPLSLVIGVSFSGLTFLGHETLHGAVVRHRQVRHVVGFVSFLPFMVSPRLWIAWHNRVHHGNTNIAGKDPDCYPTLTEYRDRRSVRVATDFAAPGRRRLRGVFSLLIGFSVQSAHMFLAASRRGYLSRREHVLATLEVGLGVSTWLTVALLIGLGPFVLCFVVPLSLANAAVMAHILTNHSLSPLGLVNDPLLNSLTVTVPRWMQWLTLGFGFHVEHHLFPAMSPRYAPRVRAVLQRIWPERYQSLPLGRALLTLHRSARVYSDDHTLLDPHTGHTWEAMPLRLADACKQAKRSRTAAGEHRPSWT
jgi:fatty acid desaturase